MRILWLTAAGALLALAPAGALGQTVSAGGVLSPPILQPGGGSLYPGNGSLFPSPVPSQGGIRVTRHGLHDGVRRGGHRGFGGTVFIEEEPDVVHDVVVVHDEAAAAPEAPPPPPPPREPYVIGRTYASLPGGCLKMVEGGASYFHCSEGWYRQVGAQYRAVAGP
jgi:hypothetical protein